MKKKLVDMSRKSIYKEKCKVKMWCFFKFNAHEFLHYNVYRQLFTHFTTPYSFKGLHMS